MPTWKKVVLGSVLATILLIVLFGLAVVTDSSWRTFWPDLIIGVIGAGGIGALLTANQARMEHARERERLTIRWAQLRPKVLRAFVNQDYDHGVRLLDRPSPAIAELAEVEGVDEVPHLAATLKIDEIGRVAKVLTAHEMATHFGERIENRLVSATHGMQRGNAVMREFRNHVLGRPASIVDAPAIAELMLNDGFLAEMVAKFQHELREAKVAYASAQSVLRPFA